MTRQGTALATSGPIEGRHDPSRRTSALGVLSQVRPNEARRPGCDPLLRARPRNRGTPECPLSWIENTPPQLHMHDARITREGPICREVLAGCGWPDDPDAQVLRKHLRLDPAATGEVGGTATRKQPRDEQFGRGRCPSWIEGLRAVPRRRGGPAGAAPNALRRECSQSRAWGHTRTGLRHIPLPPGFDDLGFRG